MNLLQRAELYNQAFPNYPPLVATDRWLYGVWVLGNNYKSRSNYYGEYPPTYLKRVTALFPDKQPILHLFSGTVPKALGDTFDINPALEPTYVGRATELSTVLPRTYGVIYADPPYSAQDAEHYGVPLVNKKKVLSECYRALDVGGYLVWLDQSLPMFRKVEFSLVGTIGIVRSTNHRVRMVFIFQRQKKPARGVIEDDGR